VNPKIHGDESLSGSIKMPVSGLLSCVDFHFSQENRNFVPK
jgi:hypothetical protein